MHILICYAYDKPSIYSNHDLQKSEIAYQDNTMITKPKKGKVKSLIKYVPSTTPILSKLF